MNSKPVTDGQPGEQQPEVNQPGRGTRRAEWWRTTLRNSRLVAASSSGRG